MIPLRKRNEKKNCQCWKFSPSIFFHFFSFFYNMKNKHSSNQHNHMPQENTNTSYDTAKQIAKQNTMETWHNDWALGDKGRRLYQHQPKPNPKDPINQLSRRDQCNIFRLRTGHSTLNLHRNRIDPLYPPCADTVCTHTRQWSTTCYIVQG